MDGYNKPLLNCICGKKPKLERVPIWTNKVKYYRYSCECGEHSFASREEIFCRETWSAMIERKLKKV